MESVDRREVDQPRVGRERKERERRRTARFEVLRPTRDQRKLVIEGIVEVIE